MQNSVDDNKKKSMDANSDDVHSDDTNSGSVNPDDLPSFGNLENDQNNNDEKDENHETGEKEAKNAKGSEKLSAIDKIRNQETISNPDEMEGFAPWQPPPENSNDSDEDTKNFAAAQYDNPGLNPNAEIEPSLVESDEERSSPRMGRFVSRLLAVIVDAIILVLCMTIVVMLAYQVLPISYYYEPPIPTWPFYIFIPFLYRGFFHTKFGQTPGKMILKIKVVRAEGLGHISWGQSFLRDLLGVYLSGMIFLLGYIWYFFSTKRQCWHDLIAHTYVVQVNKQGILMDGKDRYPKRIVGGVILFLAVILISTVPLWFFSFYIYNFIQNMETSDTYGYYSDSRELINAIERYEVSFNSYPWEDVSGSKPLPLPDEAGLPLLQDGEVLIWIDEGLLKARELKPEFLERDSLENLLIWYDAENDFVYICYDEDSSNKLLSMFYSNKEPHNLTCYPSNPYISNSSDANAFKRSTSKGSEMLGLDFDSSTYPSTGSGVGSNSEVTGSSDGGSNSGPLAGLTQSQSRLASARDATRKVDVNTITTALTTYMLETGDLPSSMDFMVPGKKYQIGSCSSGATATCQGAESKCVNIAFQMSNYLRSVPIDPLDGTSTMAGYTLMIDPNNSSVVTVSACNPEATSSIMQKTR